jgi:hypothetical protein
VVNREGEHFRGIEQDRLDEETAFWEQIAY